MEPLAGLVRAIRTAGAQPVQPSHELADRMASGVFVIDRPDRRTKVGMTSSKLAAMSLRTKVAIGCAVALTGSTGVTAAEDALPDAHATRRNDDRTVLIDFDRAEFGQEVAEDAQDDGVGGQQISEQAREGAAPAAQRPEPGRRAPPDRYSRRTSSRPFDARPDSARTRTGQA